MQRKLHLFVALLFNTQKTPDIDEEVTKVVHEGDFTDSVDSHVECRRGQVVEGL